MTPPSQVQQRAFDAAVIGAGPNGLAAAVTLAQAGRRVVVYEAADTVGGGTRTAELTLPGFRHDICSAIHPMAVGSPFLRSLPLEAHGLSWVHPEVPLAHPLDDGTAAVLARDLGETAAGLGRDGGRWRALMSDFPARWDELAADAMAPLGLPGSPLLMARFGLRAALPTTWLGRLFRDDSAAALLAGLAAHSILPLDRPPSAAIGLMLGVAGHAVGWPFPRGGAQAIADALASLLASLGGVIRTGVNIGALGEVETSGPVLFDTGPRALVTIAGDALPARYRRRLLRYRYGPGVFKLDYALDGPIPWRSADCARAGTVHLGGTLGEIAASEAASCRGDLPERPYVLVAQQSLFDPTRAPEGRHTGWAYCHVPSGSTVDMTDAIEAQIERFAPGFRDRVLARSAWNSADFERHDANYVGGDVIGGAADLAQLFTRPVARLDPYATPNPRLTLCSASTPPGGGVHGLCGWFAALSVLRRWR